MKGLDGWMDEAGIIDKMNDGMDGWMEGWKDGWQATGIVM